jgi:hypothetical protein
LVPPPPRSARYINLTRLPGGQCTTAGVALYGKGRAGSKDAEKSDLVVGIDVGGRYRLRATGGSNDHIAEVDVLGAGFQRLRAFDFVRERQVRRRNPDDEQKKEPQNRKREDRRLRSQHDQPSQETAARL